MKDIVFNKNIYLKNTEVEIYIKDINVKMKIVDVENWN